VNVLGMRACKLVHDKLSCTRLQNYTVGASLLCIRIWITKSNIPVFSSYFLHPADHTGISHTSIFACWMTRCVTCVSSVALNAIIMHSLSTCVLFDKPLWRHNVDDRAAIFLFVCSHLCVLFFLIAWKQNVAILDQYCMPKSVYSYQFVHAQA